MSPTNQFGSALTALALAAATQAQSEFSNLKRVSSLQHATLDLVTGELSDKKAVGAPCWSNTDTSTFFAAPGSTGGVDEWIAEGDNTMSNEATGCGDPTDIIRSFTFGYASNAINTSIGGPGAMMGLNFYDGTVIGSTAGSFTSGFILSGLPGTTVPTTSAPGYAISIDLVAADREFVMGDGKFGFGWVFFQVGTGPLLCYAGNNLTQGRDNNGQIDAFDWYSPPAASGGTYLGTFVSGFLSHASWYLAFEEEAGTCGAAGVSGEPLDGGGLNPLGHSASAAAIGSPYVATCTSPTGTGSICLLLALTGSAPDLVVTLGGLSQEIEVDVFTGTTLVTLATSFVGGVATLATVVPVDLELCGLTAATQCIGFATGAAGPGVRLSNGLSYTIGF